MTTMRKPFRFGLMSNGGDTPSDTVRLAQQAEALGFHGFYINDHYAGPGPAMTAANHAPQVLAALPLAAAIAGNTSAIAIGFRVICIDYHHPVVLAKELATIDAISPGRLDVGLGAGWMKSEYDAMGIPFDPPGTRIDRLGDVVKILRASFAGEPLDVAGVTGLQVAGFSARPVPEKMPTIAIGGGRRRMLSLAARLGDVVAFNVAVGDKLAPSILDLSNAQKTREQIGWVRDAADDRFDELELEVGVPFVVHSDRIDESLEARLVEETGGLLRMSTSAALEHPHVLIGDVDRIVDTLEERRDTYGFNRVTVLARNMEKFAPVVARLGGR
ncbi:TIGR03621 family F420-dependent LLM class oxidoreductase [Rhodococcus sp. WAY2]|uniref:TIGR03621 family F420-dependent LLM class oxidoreductase n=1 Tax=Rhodococcus sp. WAY2 TaxID=2663121 RepID=UPI0013201868|nr:TIGR03621 family F420-dependent LLM class oxidoreductase [Rhodococcus sp. WAY2]QHE73284.1 putative oxygenase [Rhodococcus sp. WAY2]